MTDPERGERPSLEDELFGTAAAGPADGARAAAPRINLPWRAPWEDGRIPGRRDTALGSAGFTTFLLVDGVVMYGPLMGGNTPTVLPQTVILIVVAFGLGGLLAWHVRGAWRPYGFGMMLGWVFLTLISAGFLTGVMP
jgi:hypothetical protein